MLDAETFENERPVIYSMEQIEMATSNFDETRKIGEGGYGSVYLGILGELVSYTKPSFQFFFYVNKITKKVYI